MNDKEIADALAILRSIDARTEDMRKKLSSINTTVQVVGVIILLSVLLSICGSVIRYM